MSPYPDKCSLWDMRHPDGRHDSLSIVGGRVRSACVMKHLAGYTVINAKKLLESGGWTIHVVIEADAEVAPKQA